MYLTDLADVLRDAGLPVVEVPGWKSRGRSRMTSVDTITCHHTATPRTFKQKTDYPTMSVVKDGRAGLSGPLAQLGLGRTGTWYVIAAGRANHAGKSRETRYTNSHALGIEAEGAMETWPDAQYQSYARGVRALAAHYGAVVLGHKETCSPVGRKQDPSFSMDDFRAAVAKAPTTTPSKETETTLMTTISDEYKKAQTVAPGKTVIVRVRKTGQHRIAPAKTGTKVTLGARVKIYGLDAGEGAELRIVRRRWDNGKNEYIFDPPVIVRGRNREWPESGETTQADVSGYGDDRTEYQLTVRNLGSQPITIAHARIFGFHD